jgi:outer membrane protein TolC
MSAIWKQTCSIEKSVVADESHAAQRCNANKHYEQSFREYSRSTTSLPISRLRENPIYRVSPAAFHFILASLRVILTVPILFLINGCALLHLDFDREVAPTERPDQAWTPPLSVTEANETVSKIDQLRRFDRTDNQPASSTKVYDLPSLVDLALRTNPQTRHAWYAALAANAELGQSQAPNYPKVEVDGEGGYLKLPIQFPGQTLVIRNEAFLPQFKVSYDLLDFGRTRATERGAREQLIAMNFAFNRGIQDVVFNVEKAYYVLSAANASVSAAEANLKLARTSFSAVQERHQMGLATGPAVLLARQVEAQGVYDLENAKSMVHDADAGLRQAVGVAADTDIRIQEGRLDQLPTNLSDDVETMMTEALKQRPDIASQIATVRGDDAAIARARAEFYPEVEISGNYGQVIWSYTVNGGPTQNLNQPFYGALLTLRWDLFTGFDRYYGLQKATAARDAARSELKSLQLNVITGVWTAYYDYRSAKKKRDASEALVAASEDSYQANLESHRHGLATISDLIAAERDLMAARYTLIQSKADFMISSCALLHANGAASVSSARTH